MARCPAHEDKVQSLSIKTGQDGKTLLFCHAGCSLDDILNKLDLEQKDLFADNGQQQSEPLATYDYTDASGKLLYQVLRKIPKDFIQRRPDGSGGWIYKEALKGVDRVPYRLPEVIEAVKTGKPIYVVEGEKDCNRLASLSLTATTNSGGALKWLDSLSLYFKGAKVVIIPDNDPPDEKHPLGVGREHALMVAKSLTGIATAIKIVNLPGLPEKGDVSDWLKAGHTKAELINIVKEAKQIESSYFTLLNECEHVNLPYQPLSAYPLTEQSFIIEGFLPQGVISTLYGDGGQGKSYLSLSIAVKVASGSDFLGKNVKQGRVLYLDFELSGQAQRQRLEQICKGLEISPESLSNNLLYAAPGIDETAPAKLNDWIGLLEKDKFDLIILDSVGAALQGDAESAKDICSLFQRLRKLGTVLLLDHHAKRQSGDKETDDKSPFGSTYKQALTRNLWHLRSKQEDGRFSAILKHKKSNLTALLEPIGLEYRWKDGAFIVEGCEIGAEFSDHLGTRQQVINALEDIEKPTAKKIASEINKSVAYVRNILTSLKETGIVEETGEKDGKEFIYRKVHKFTTPSECEDVNIKTPVQDAFII